jgi:hypothetical protein
MGVFRGAHSLQVWYLASTFYSMLLLGIVVSTNTLVAKIMCRNTYNKLPKFAAKSAAGTNTHWASPNNARICPLAKRYVSR